MTHVFRWSWSSNIFFLTNVRLTDWKKWYETVHAGISNKEQATGGPPQVEQQLCRQRNDQCFTLRFSLSNNWSNLIVIRVGKLTAGEYFQLRSSGQPTGVSTVWASKGKCKKHNVNFPQYSLDCSGLRNVAFSEWMRSRWRLFHFIFKFILSSAVKSINF